MRASLAAITLAGCGAAMAQTTLVPGDIAIVGYNADTTPGDGKGFAFVALRDLQAGTEIMFTDSGYNSGTGFRTTEGCLVYTAPAAITKGTVVKYLGTGASYGNFARDDTRGFGTNGVNLSTSGDQLYALQGTGIASNTAIFAFDMNGGFVDATSSNDGGVPPGLTVGTNALALAPEGDNAQFNATRTGYADKAAALAAIMTTTNWTTSDASAFTLDTTVFTPLPVSVSRFSAE